MYEPPLHAFSALVGAIRSRRPAGGVHRILIYKLDHLGDVLLATPVLRAIRRHYPAAEIKIVIGEWSRNILAHNPSVDEIICYNSGRFARPPYVPHTFRELQEKLGSWKPDLVIGLRDDWYTITDSLLSGAWRIQRGGVHLREWWEQKRRGTPDSHEIDRLWKALSQLGIEPEPGGKIDYFVTHEERGKAAGIMAARGIRAPFAVIHAGASVPLKEWPIERFAAVARHIAAEGYGQLVLIGSPDEVGHSARLAAMIRELDPVDISGMLDVRTTAALLEQASLYLGADGGMMHIATALNIPTVGLFGPGSLDIFRPTGDRSIAISHRFPCSPCFMVKCIRPDDNCMQAITVEEVVQATGALLDNKAGIPVKTE